jgi:hypothetical protein
VRMTTATRAAAVMLLLVFMCAARASAQMGTINGTVVDRSQSTAVRGASIRLSGHPQQVTDGDGRFRILDVAPGTYMLAVDAVGYRPVVFQITLRADTTLTIQLDPAPLPLDSLVVQARYVTIRGSVRDSATGLKLMQAQATVYPGGLSEGARSGDFTIKNVPAGDSVTVVVEALEHLPARVTFVANRDTALNISLGIDSVALRMVAKQVERLELRVRTLPHTVDALNAEALRTSAAGTMDELLRRRLPTTMFSIRPPYAPIVDLCMLYNDKQTNWFVLQGIEPAQIERVEIIGRARDRELNISYPKMIRVYSRSYVIALMSRENLPHIVLGDYGLGTVCS